LIKLIKSVSKMLRNAMNDPYIIDKLISQAEIVTINGRNYIRKRYAREVGIMKWLPPALFLKPIYPFTLEPRERLRREVNFFRSKWNGFKVPNILSYDENKLELIREYVEGRLINYRSDDDLRMLAKVFAEIHSKRYALGDVKPTNFLVNNNGDIYVIDAEQAVSDANIDSMSWDLLATLLISAYFYIANITKYREAIRLFFKEYLSSNGGENVLANIASQKFVGLAILIPLPHLISIVEVLEDLI